MSSLPSSGSADTTAYGTLNVPGMAAGTAFDDPVTGVRTVKLTANGTPSSSQYCPVYSMQGLSISQAWGASSDTYTLLFINISGSGYLCDYTLGGTPTNYRTVTGVNANGNHTFSRKAGEERILYIHTGTQLRRYDTAANAYADTGVFPISWSVSSISWLMINAAHTYAACRGSSGTTIYGANLSTGSTFTQTVGSLDDIYMGYNNVALINQSAQVWNLATNTLSSVGSRPGGWGPLSHLPSMNGFWSSMDTNIGGGHMGIVRIAEDGSVSSPVVYYPRYWGQWHLSGHWWTQGSGSNQHMLMSAFQSGGGGWSASDEYIITFIDCSDGTPHVLGHSYSDAPSAGSTDDYWSQPHATISNDGKLVMFGSNMLNSSRIDAFLMEVPRAA